MPKLHIAIASTALVLTSACSEPEPRSEPLPPQTSLPETAPSPTVPTPPPSETKPSKKEPAPTGIVSVRQMSFDLGNTYHAGAAAMFGSKVGPPKDACTTTTHGPCTVSICSSMAKDTKPPPSAGRVWFGLPDRVLELNPLADGTYPEAQYEERLFEPNDEISASAAGKDFPAFSLAVSAPPDVTMIAPSLDDLLKWEWIDRKKPYTVTWQPAKSGAEPVIVTATIIASKPPNVTLHVCEGKLEDGSLTIPQAAVALIGETKGDEAGGMLFVGTSRRQSLELGSEVIRFEVVSMKHSAVIEPFN